MNLPSCVVVAYLLTSFVSMSFALNCTIFYEYTYGTSSSVVRSGSQACSQDGVEYACINFIYGGLILPDQSTTEWIPGTLAEGACFKKETCSAFCQFNDEVELELAQDLNVAKVNITLCKSSCCYTDNCNRASILRTDLKLLTLLILLPLVSFCGNLL